MTNVTRVKRYRAWHIPQIPGKPFVHDTDSLDEAKLIIDVLADYDLFQFEHNIKPDYANMNGVTEWDDEEGEYLDVDEDDFVSGDAA